MLESFKSKPLFNMGTISTLMVCWSANEKYFKSY